MNENTLSEEPRIHTMRWCGHVDVSMHSHDFIEVVYIASGSCVHDWQGTVVRLVPGDVFIIAPHETHAFAIEAETVIYNCLFYPAALGDDWLNLQEDPCLQNLLVLEPLFRRNSGRQEILHLDSGSAGRLESLLNTMIEEASRERPGYKISIKALLRLVLVSLGRQWNSQFEGLSGLYDERRGVLAEVLTYIDRHAAEDLSLNDLASRCYVSPGHFRKLFRETMGLSPNDYINKLRISLAQKLLSEHTLTVTQVGAAVGIPDPNYFARLFKSLVGCSPSAFRKRTDGEGTPDAGK